MPSTTEISNMALTIANKCWIEDIEEDSDEANVCKIFLHPSKRSILRTFPFPFAVGFMNPARVPIVSHKYQFVYQKPKWCLKVLEVLQQPTTYQSSYYSGARSRQVLPPKNPFEVFGTKIHTDVEQCMIKYTKDVVDTDEFDDLFVEALAHRLAVFLIMRFTRDAKHAQTVFNTFLNILNLAKSAAVSEAHVPDLSGRRLVNARRSTR